MRLQMILPRVQPDRIVPPTTCPHPGCTSTHFQLHQIVTKPLIDTHFSVLTAHRYRCLGCGRTFRVYPQGVDHHATSRRIRGLSVLLYLLGLSYGAVSLTLEALGVFQAKSSVYEAVQHAAEQVADLAPRGWSPRPVRALGADLTSVKCHGEWLTLGLITNDVRGTVLNINLMASEEAEALTAWIAPVAEALGVELLVSDDADGFKQVADALDLQHQVCKSHVVRNTEALVEELLPLVASDADGSLAALGRDPATAVNDLERLLALVRTRRPEDEEQLEGLHLPYARAPAPAPGRQAGIAYRLRMLTLDRWELWPRLTRYRDWRGADGEQIDGTNNSCERAIGWWVKERYRTMRGYKRKRSALNVSRLIAFCGNRLDRGGVDLAPLVA
jgi:transposase-like protein